MIVAVISSFNTTASRAPAGFDALLANPAVRALYGMPFDVTTAGGFTVWRFGTFICMPQDSGRVMATTRVLRGEEEAGRWDLLLTASVTREGVLLGHSKVLAGGHRRHRAHRVRSFAGLRRTRGTGRAVRHRRALFTLTFVAVGAVTSQLFGARRRALGTAGAVLGISVRDPHVGRRHDRRRMVAMGHPARLGREPAGVRRQPPPPAGPAGDHPADPVRRRHRTRPTTRHRRGHHPRHGHGRRSPRLLRSPLGFAWRNGSVDCWVGDSGCSRSGSSWGRSPRRSSTSSPTIPTSPN